MMGRPHWRMQPLVAAMLAAFALSLVGLSPSHAAAASSSRTDVVNGMPCNDLCKAYMAWSDRMKAQFSVSRPQPHAQLRTAAHTKRPERTAHHMAATRRSGLNSFAQLPGRSDPPPQSAEPAQAETAPSQPTGVIADGFSPPDGALAERRADAATEFPETMPIDAADPRAATPEPVASGRIVGRPAMQLPLSLILALCALLAFGSWGWIRGRTRDASALR
jgi:hypothetical protein